MNNHAYIDSQNLYMGLQSLGWQVDFKKFRKFLKDKYHVSEAYWFIGYLPENQHLYEALQKAGFITVFKDVSRKADGTPKGNVDVHLTLYAVLNIKDYDQAVIVTSDGDFGVLVEHLKEVDKLRAVLSPTRKYTSFLLRRAASAI